MTENRTTDAEIIPLDGEQGIPNVQAPPKGTVAFKGVMAIVVVVLGLVFSAYATITRFLGTPAEASASAADERKGPKAAATVSTGRVFDPRAQPVPEQTAINAPAIVVPAIESEEEQADPIGLRDSRDRSGRKTPSPLDAPAVLTLISASDTRVPQWEESEQQPGVRDTNLPGQQSQSSTSAARARLDQAQSSLTQYQENLKGLVANLQKTAIPGAAATGTAGALPAAASAGAGASGLAKDLNVGGTARVSAGYIGNRSLMLPKGTTFTCALKTKIVSELAGLASCQVLRNVYSDDGRVLLVDRGSHLDGEYSARLRNGQSRIFVVWSRLRTPDGVTVDIGSPATGPLGEAGVDGYVDNHYGQRIGAALLLTLIEDGLKIAAADAASSDGGTAVILGDSANTTSSLAEKVLDSTINIPPTIYKLQGEVVGIYVSKDVDFSSVYELRTAAR